MARASTTSDAFNAIAEPQRRAILNLLAGGERSVNEIATKLQMNQPQTSKHLRVLKEVGLVGVRGAGQKRLYYLQAEGLKPVHDWVSSFQEIWNQRLDRLESYLKELQEKEKDQKKS